MTETVGQDRRKKIIRVICLIVIDIFIIMSSAILSLTIRFDFSVAAASEYMPQLYACLPVFTILSVAVFIPMKLYSSLWEFASIAELMHILYASAIICLLQLIAILMKLIVLPMSFPILNWLFLTAMIAAFRFSYRLLRGTHYTKTKKSTRKRTMLIGAGDAGMLVLREFQTSVNSENQVVCVVDDNIQKRGRYLRNVKICGTRKDIVRLAVEYDIEEIIFAIPTASVRDRKEILSYCQQSGCRLKILPGIFQLANGEVSVQKIRDVDILDLLGRDSVQVDMSEISQMLRQKVVLVTGGGGSIGSELCRQIAKYEPKTLILVDIYENNAYEIQQELRRAYPELNLVTLIASVRDSERILAIFNQYHPQIIFHAAAHKHVPLMEDSPNEAIKNNVFGTYHVAKAAAVYRAETFVLISTDKAVNPTNIMGASKRICEMIVQMMANSSKTKFVAVRFGNVLGSNGSVIPLFKKQIAEGGPVTVTHPDIIRFFMTIPEAVSLVLQAGVYADRGEIFVLDMGEPVRIDDLARNLIRLSGFEPDLDIEVKYTGLRPGEKLYEEMLMSEEGLRTTANELIHIGQPLELNDVEFAKQLVKLETACAENSDQIFDMVEQIVPTYRRPQAVK
ncbi:MAG: polysaccharide biosynthesis protein [Ruminococcaceae bacterium]|nr:polysaccharide biosynthesis protein [Oscillospiraceae bacterium]